MSRVPAARRSSETTGSRSTVNGDVDAGSGVAEGGMLDDLHGTSLPADWGRAPASSGASMAPGREGCGSSWAVMLNASEPARGRHGLIGVLASASLALAAPS